MREPNTTEGSTPIRVIFARNLRYLRTRANLSQREVAKQTGMPQTYISALELATWSVGIDNIALIAKAFGVTPMDMLDPDFGEPRSRSAKKNFADDDLAPAKG